MKAALINLDFAHSSRQISMDFPNVNWKRTKIIKEHRRIGNSYAPDIMELGSCRLPMIHGAYYMAQKANDLGRDNFLKPIYSSV